MVEWDGFGQSHEVIVHGVMYIGAIHDPRIRSRMCVISIRPPRTDGPTHLVAVEDEVELADVLEALVQRLHEHCACVIFE